MSLFDQKIVLSCREVYFSLPEKHPYIGRGDPMWSPVFHIRVVCGRIISSLRCRNGMLYRAHTLHKPQSGVVVTPTIYTIIFATARCGRPSPSRQSRDTSPTGRGLLECLYGISLPRRSVLDRLGTYVCLFLSVSISNTTSCHAP